MRAHDEIGQLYEQRLKAAGGSTTLLEIASQRQSGGYLYTEDILSTKMPVETIKMVGLRRDPSKPLGLTVELDEYKQLVVARILAGGVIDKQSMLHVGDVILEVNGTPVRSPDELQVEVSRAKENLTLKIGPNVDEEIKSGRYTVSGGQVKQNGIAGLETGKKLTVSSMCAWLGLENWVKFFPKIAACLHEFWLFFRFVCSWAMDFLYALRTLKNWNYSKLKYTSCL